MIWPHQYHFLRLPPPLTTSHRSVLQIPAQGGQGVGRHQDRPRLRPGEREDRADAGPTSRDVVRYTETNVSRVFT